MKFIFKSKTFWAALIQAALLAFSPLVQKYASEHPGIWACFIAFVFIFLRLITKDKIIWR